MLQLLSDLRLGLRMIRKRPGTSFLAMAALTLGIGLTTTMFSIVQGAFLRGLPFEESDRILHLGRQRPSQSADDLPVPLHDYREWRAQQRSLSDMAAFHGATYTLAGDGDVAERVSGAVMTASTLALLRTAPLLGRDFNEADEAPGAEPVALIGYRIWQDRFGGDPGIVGRPIRLNGRAVTVVGVMPERFGFPNSQSLWTPLENRLPERRGQGPFLEVIGRLADGVSEEQASADLVRIAAQLERQYPENEGLSAVQQPYLHEFLGDDVRSTLLAMLGAVFGVLLIACANVTNLQLARAAERAREVAIRSAMGAGRWRVVRQMLVEGLLLSSCGALGGIALAATGVALFNRAIVDTEPPFWIDIRLDATVLAFVVALTVIAALVSSVFPALRVTRGAAAEVLKDEGRSSTSLRAGWVTRALVVVAVTLSCGLLIVSGLMIKNVVQLGNLVYPFATADVLLASVNGDQRTYPEQADMRRLADRLEESLTAIPGVSGVGVSTSLPTGGGTGIVMVEGRAYPEPDERPRSRRQSISADYFRALGVSAMAGRLLTTGDRDGALPVAVVNADFAAQLFPDGGAIGSRIRLGDAETEPWRTIVGIVPTLAVAPEPDSITADAFVPLAQSPDRSFLVFLRAAGGSAPSALAGSLRRAIVSLDQDLALSDVNALDAFYYQNNWAYRVFGTLFMSFGFAALVMATAGLYGVLAFAVRKRTAEIGLRMALGAGRGRVVRMVLRQGVLYIGIGLVLGVGVGLLFGPLMQELLNNVSPRDPMVFATTIGVLALTGLVASLVPALRAASVDPNVALRHE